MRPDLVDADVRHELVELPEHVRSKGQPERKAYKVEVVVGRDPQHEFEKEGVGFAGEEQDNHDGGEEEGAHTGHAVPLHFVPLVRCELLHCTRQLFFHALTAGQGGPVVTACELKLSNKGKIGCREKRGGGGGAHDFMLK